MTGFCRVVMLPLMHLLIIPYLATARRMDDASNNIQLLVGTSGSASLVNQSKSDNLNRSRIIMCNPVCARCKDGTEFMIMRDMDDRQFRRMLAVQGVTLAAQLTLRALLPGVPDAAHAAAHVLIHSGVADLIFSWVATKLQDKTLQLTIDYLDDAMQGENKCNSVGVLANTQMRELFPFGDQANPPGSQEYYYATIDSPSTGQREFIDEQVTDLDVWRKSMDDIVDRERAKKGWSFIGRNLKATHEWAGSDLYKWIEAPDAIHQLIHDSPLFCGLREGAADVVIMGNVKSWGVKSETLGKLQGYQNQFDAVFGKCEEIWEDFTEPGYESDSSGTDSGSSGFESDYDVVSLDSESD